MNSKITNKTGKKQAFTIIEVVLVLAIAGLIFLIVFLALPGLQRSRRDTQRKSDLGNMSAALENYASNNGGKYPATTGAGYTAGEGISTLLSGFTPAADPQGGNYNVNAAGTGSSTNSIITYVQGGICTNGVATANSGGAFKYAISVVLENGNYCKDGGQTPS